MRPYMTIHHQDGQQYTTDVLGLKMVDLKIPSTQYEFISEGIESGVGSVVVDTFLREKTMTAIFDFYYSDIEDLRLFETQLSRVFSVGKQISIVESPTPWKMYNVFAKPYNLDRGNGVKGRIEVPFLLPTGLAESINSTKVMHVLNPGSNTIRFDNTGTFEIDQRNRAEMKIKFSNGVSENLRITNFTTNDVWQYNGPLTTNDVVLLSHYTTFVNGVNRFRNTNKAVITLAPGENVIQISGILSTTIMEIDTKMYFK